LRLRPARCAALIMTLRIAEWGMGVCGTFRGARAQERQISSSATAQRGRGTARSAVEGARDSQLLRRHSDDCISDLIDLFGQIVCSDPHQRYPRFSSHASLRKSRCGRSPMSWLTPSISIARLAFAQ
jgi:hypothetical protein